MSRWHISRGRRKHMMEGLDEDIRDFIERESQDNIERGMSPEEARYAALRKFGNVTRVKEDTREVWSLIWLEHLWQDIRFGLRMLAKNRGFTAVAVVTLALGIGPTTAIFSLVDAVMLRFLPVQKPEELLQLTWHDPLRRTEDSRFTPLVWEQFRDRQDVFSSVLASSWVSQATERFDLSQGGAVDRANGLYASGSYFSTLGVRPAIGRLLNTADDQPGCPGVAVLSYGFWQEHFGGNRNVLGKSLSLSYHPFQIIGVTGPGFYGVNVGYNFDVAIPICAGGLVSKYRQRSGGAWLMVMGRLKPGISQQQLNARLAVLSPEIWAGLGPTPRPPAAKRVSDPVLMATPARTGLPILRHQLEEPLRIMMAVVGLVLLIVCANIASLMLGRAASRGKEIAVRRALGASRTRLIRQLLTECILLSSAGAIIGVVFARWGAALLVYHLSTLRNQIFLNFSPDASVLGFATGAAIITGILFGLLPAFRSTRVSLASAMKGSEATAVRSSTRFRLDKWTVSLQVALSLALLVAAGLFIRSFEKLVTLDIGFDQSNVLLANVNLEGAHIAPEQRPQSYDEIEERLRSLSGVTSASRSFMTPISGDGWTPPVRIGSSAPPSGIDGRVLFNAVSPAYMDTLRMSLLAGRNFNKGDTAAGSPVAIIDQTFAQKFYPGVNPVGEYIRVAYHGPKFGPPILVVGLTKNSNFLSARDDTWPMALIPISQMPADQWNDPPSVVTYDPANDGHPKSGQWFPLCGESFFLCFGLDPQGAFDLRLLVSSQEAK